LNRGVSVLPFAEEDLGASGGDQAAEEVRPFRSLPYIRCGWSGVLPRQIQLVASDRLRESYAEGHRPARASVPASDEQRRRKLVHFLLLFGGHHSADHITHTRQAALDQINQKERSR
jgi:hypothetical protein